MASPPYSYSPTALSPPYPTAAQLPNKKRTADVAGVPGAQPPSLKRRKASTLSVASATSAHPLRQTSFPPEGQSPFPRSPSADTMSHVSGSQVSGAAGPIKKKRGRKAKNAGGGGAGGGGRAGSDSKEQTPSLVGGRANTNTSGANGVDKEAGVGEEEDEADGPLELVDATVRTQEQKQEEIRLRAMLVEAMDTEQLNRYEVWRASKLSDAVVKRVGSSGNIHGLFHVVLTSVFYRWLMQQSRSRCQQTLCLLSSRSRNFS
jgi:transcription initiation factor TFIID subunit 11